MVEQLTLFEIEEQKVKDEPKAKAPRKKKPKTKVRQSTIFHYPAEPHEFKVGDYVMIKHAEELEGLDVLRKYYLADDRHGGKKGRIKEIHQGKNVVSYLVEHDKGQAWVCAEELVYLG